jgi:hypothetical protein
MRESQLFADRIFGGLPFVTLLGLLGVAVMALLGFEQPWLIEAEDVSMTWSTLGAS